MKWQVKTMENSLEQVMPFLVIIPFLAAVGILLLIWQRSKSYLEIEQGKTALLTVRCAGTIGLTRYRGPFIRLSLYQEFLVIRSLKSIVLYYYEISHVKDSQSLLDKSLHIYHTNQEHPKTIRLLPMKNNKQQVLEVLKTKVQMTNT